MSYTYKKKTPEQLEAIAAGILAKKKDRCNGFVVNIEGIIEDCDITILPRSNGLHQWVYGYAAKDPHYIIVAEMIVGSLPTYRVVLAEELSHIVLEFDLWTADKLPEGAHCHELTPEQHDEIEDNADYLSCALLCAKDHFSSQYHRRKSEAQPLSNDQDRITRVVIDQLAKEDFGVMPMLAARRAVQLGLITKDSYKRNFLDRIPL